MTAAYEPAQVFSLAEHLCEEMQARGWTTGDVAARMGAKTLDDAQTDLLSVDLLLAVQDDALLVGDEMFAKLSRAFGVSEDLFRNMDAAWRQWPQKRSPFTAPECAFGPLEGRPA